MNGSRHARREREGARRGAHARARRPHTHHAAAWSPLVLACGQPTPKPLRARPCRRDAGRSPQSAVRSPHRIAPSVPPTPSPWTARPRTGQGTACQGSGLRTGHAPQLLGWRLPDVLRQGRPRQARARRQRAGRAGQQAAADVRGGAPLEAADQAGVSLHALAGLCFRSSGGSTSVPAHTAPPTQQTSTRPHTHAHTTWHGPPRRSRIECDERAG